MHGHRSGNNFMSHMLSAPMKSSFNLLVSFLILVEAEADTIVYKIAGGHESWKSRSITKSWSLRPEGPLAYPSVCGRIDLIIL